MNWHVVWAAAAATVWCAKMYASMLGMVMCAVRRKWIQVENVIEFANRRLQMMRLVGAVQDNV